MTDADALPVRNEVHSAFVGLPLALAALAEPFLDERLVELFLLAAGAADPVRCCAA